MSNCEITCGECMASNDGKCPKVLHTKEPWVEPVLDILKKEEEKND